MTLDMSISLRMMPSQKNIDSSMENVCSGVEFEEVLSNLNDAVKGFTLTDLQTDSQDDEVTAVDCVFERGPVTIYAEIFVDFAAMNSDQVDLIRKLGV